MIKFLWKIFENPFIAMLPSSQFQYESDLQNFGKARIIEERSYATEDHVEYLESQNKALLQNATRDIS